MAKTKTLDQLEQQRAALTKKIKAEKEKQRREARHIENKRHAIIGRLITQEAETKPDLKRTIDTLLNTKLTRKTDRALFALPPLPGNTDKQDH